MTPFRIAIDGPVAAGKGTVAKLVAKRLGFLYVDTGAMYRTAALLSQEQGIDWTEGDRVARLVGQASISMRNPSPEESDGRQTTVIANGTDISWAIRTEAMSRGSSAVAKLPQVRQVLVEKQQEIASSQDVVMEGRDITFRVLPNADLKIFLTANEAVRAKRRHQELLVRGEDITFEQVLKDLQERDRQDRERATDPLQIVPGTWVLDTTPYTIDEVVDMIEQKVNEVRGSFNA